MLEEKRIPVSKLKSGKSGRVIEISGGKGVTDRLAALGIRPGQKLTKISSMLWKGPVTIQAGHTRVAIGHGMASKIIVDPE